MYSYQESAELCKMFFEQSKDEFSLKAVEWDGKCFQFVQEFMKFEYRPEKVDEGHVKMVFVRTHAIA